MKSKSTRKVKSVALALSDEFVELLIDMDAELLAITIANCDVDKVVRQFGRVKDPQRVADLALLQLRRLAGTEPCGECGPIAA